MEHHFGGPYEISGTNVSRLWDGVSFVMQARAARATTWNCPEVEAACKEQFDGLPAYRAAVATAVSRAATALPAPGSPRRRPLGQQGVPSILPPFLVGACPRSGPC